MARRASAASLSVAAGKGNMRAHIDHRDLAAGGIFTLIGLAFVAGTYRSLSIGEAARMGPGYFPLLLGGLLALLGIAIIGRGLNAAAPAPVEGVTWRGMFLIGVAPLVFAVAIVPLGLVPALAITTLIAALSSREVGLVRAAAIAAVIVGFCVLVFSYGLRLPIPLFPSFPGGGA